MSDVKTVDDPVRISDPLVRKQREDVAKMRASLLTCSDDPTSATTAMKNITVLRVYHQISRIIRYLEMMDKIEDKLYESIDYQLENLNTENPVAWMQLLSLQERLQKVMLESHKLLQPYLNVQEFNMADLTVGTTDGSINSSAAVLSRESRDRLRSNAQQLLTVLGEDVDG